MASEAKIDRDRIKDSLRKLQNCDDQTDILSEDDEPPSGKRLPGAGPTNEMNAASGASSRARQQQSQSVTQMRRDGASARTANDIMRRTGVTWDEQSNKKQKSGYNLTMNDHVHVTAQWPRFNVHRASNNAATYSSLTVDEFCIGYNMFIEDSLEGTEPDVARAQDYLTYLHDLLSEIPLMGWEPVREAHGEMLWLVEQCRLDWENSKARSRALAKALRRAHLESLKKAESEDKGNGGDDKPPVPQKVKRPCPEYQTEKCEESATHFNDGVTWLHCCATCYRYKQQRYTHTCSEGRRQKAKDDKSKSSKNQ